jgi:hypothetical protein
MSTVSTSARVTFDDAMRLPGIIPRRSKQDSLQEIVAEFVNTNVYRIDGQSILFREFRERLAAWALKRELIVTHSPREIAGVVEALGFCYGVRHSNQRHLGNASWTDDAPETPLAEIEGRLFRITKRPTKPKPKRKPKPAPKKKRSIRGLVKAARRLGFDDVYIRNRLNARGFRQRNGKPHTTRSVRECR